MQATFVNFDLESTISGPVNFDYQSEDRETIGKWANDSISYGTTQDMQGTYFCVSAETFFTSFVPTLKKGHDQYYNWKSRKN